MVAGLTSRPGHSRHSPTCIATATWWHPPSVWRAFTSGVFAARGRGEEALAAFALVALAAACVVLGSVPGLLFSHLAALAPWASAGELPTRAGLHLPGTGNLPTLEILIVVTGLTNGQAYTFTVTAIDRAGNLGTRSYPYTVALARPDGVVQAGDVLPEQATESGLDLARIIDPGHGDFAALGDVDLRQLPRQRGRQDFLVHPIELFKHAL